MARFWKRGEDRSIEQLLRANRPEPRDEFASSILNQIADTPAPAARRRPVSSRRFGLALALTVLLIGLAGVLGGITAASAGLNGIARVAKKAVVHHTQSTATVKTTSSKKDGDDKNSKDEKGKKCDGDNDADDKGCGDNNGDKDDKGNKCDGDHDGDDKHCGDHDGDHHQYKVGVCHWADHKYILIFVSQEGAEHHLKHHPKDKLPVNGHC